MQMIKYLGFLLSFCVCCGIFFPTKLRHDGTQRFIEFESPGLNLFYNCQYLVTLCAFET